MKLALPIPLFPLKRTRGVKYPGDFNALRLQDWVQFMVDHNAWHIVCGLTRPNPVREQAILTEFWQRYRALHPEHQLFTLAGVDWSRCAPLLLHGDEGRGRKRAAFLVCAWHSVLGLGTKAANRARKHHPYLSMKLNYSGSSHTHRFLTAVLPKMCRDEAALQDILRFIASDGENMIQKGVADRNGVRYFAACINSIGDWQWLVKAGNLSRSFANVEKRPRGVNSNPRGICHLCDAGQVNVPFEDLRLGRERPWRKTMFQSSPFETMPALLQLPHIPKCEPAYFAFDLWHSYHLGVGKSFLASCLALASDCMGSTNIDGRFSQLTAEYLSFCDSNRKSAFLTVLTQATLGWPDRSTYPNGQWSKGHITTTLSKFFSHWCSKTNLASMPQSELLVLCAEANEHISCCMKQLYEHDVWIPVNTSRAIALEGLKFLDCHHRLALKAHRQSLAYFIYMPKIHIMDHIFQQMYEDSFLPQVTWVMNPLVCAVQVDEDYVGRTSRLARRAGPLQVVTRVLQRSLQASYKHWHDAKYIR